MSELKVNTINRYSGTALNIGTTNSGDTVTIGHATSEVVVGDNLTVKGDLTVTGSMNVQLDDFTVSATTMQLGDQSSDSITCNASTMSIPNNLSFLTGSVAVGTTTLSAPSGVAKYVLVSDASSAGISLNDTGGTQWDVYSADGRLNFFASVNGSGVANRMAILHDGQVGIGTIAPSTLLEVAGDVKVSGANKLYLFDSGGEYLSSDGTDLTIAAGTAINIAAGVLDLSAQTVDVTLNAAVDALNFDSNTLSIDASNNRVGIGTAAPAMPLHVVNSAGGRIMLHRSSGDSSSQLGGILFGANDGDTNLAMITAYQDGAADAAYISFETEATGGSLAERLRITSAGNVGIGVSDPDELLEVAGDVKVSGADNKLYFYDSGGEHISANASGVLSVAAGTEIDLTATTIDMNGNVDISGNALVSGEVQTANIGYTDGDNAMTIADGGAVTFPQAAVFSSGFSAGDANITNVGDIALDSISSDAGTSISITLGTDAGDDLIVATNALVVEGDNKNIGVGTATPTSDAGIAKFIEVSDASSAGIVLNDTGGRKWNIWSADSKLKVWNGTDGDVLTLWGTDVGIGTASPAKRFHLAGASSDAQFDNDIFLKSDSAVLNFGAGDDVTFTHDGGTGMDIASAGDLDISSGGNVTLTSTVNEAASIYLRENAGTSGAIKIHADQGTGATSIELASDAGGISILAGNTTHGVKIATGTSGVPITLGHGTSEVTVADNLTVTGDLTVSGTTTTVNTTTITVEDPVIKLGQSSSDDNKDRGVEFAYNDGSARLGFMGWDDSESAFTMFSAATNSSEVFSGTAAPLIIGALTAASLDISGDADIDGTLEADAITVDGTTLAEVISDTAGAMFSSNTETGITATYQDADNTIDLAIAAAQTTITSILATDLKIGEDDQTKIDFETADEIHFYANNVEQVYLADNIFGPQSDSDVDLGSTTVRWKDAYIDSVTTTGNVNAGGNVATTGNLTVAGSTTLSDNVKIIDDKTLTFGTNDDWTIEYDENGDDDLVMTGTTLSVVADTATFTSANSADPLVIIKNTTNDTTGPRLQLVKDKGAAGAADDINGLIQFVGDDANQDQVTFSQLMSQVKVATNGQEGGKFTISVAENDGTLTAGLVVEDGNADGELDVTIGAGTSSVTSIAGTLDLGDRNITNVGDISLDSISSDGSLVTINAPSEIANSSTGGATALIIDNDDTDQVAVSIEAANIDADVLDISADAVTTARVIDITADALTTGAALYIDSDSGADDARSIAHIIQNSNSAPASNTLTLQQDDATVATTTMAASLNLTGEPKIKIGTDAKALGFYQYDGYWCAGILDGNLSGQAGDGSLAHRKTVVGITAALDLSALSIAAASLYSGAVITAAVSGGDVAITLPSASSTAEANQLVGWHCRVQAADAHGTNTLTIVRGDTSNDVIAGLITSVDGSNDGVTIGSNVVTFVDSHSAAGDYVDIVCTASSAASTVYHVTGVSAT